MPNRPKTRASTYRFSHEERDLMDRLADHFQRKYGLPCSRTAVISLALGRLAEQELPPATPRPRKKKSEKPEESP